MRSARPRDTSSRHCRAQASCTRSTTLAGSLARAVDVSASGLVVGNNGWPFLPSGQQGFVGSILAASPFGSSAFLWQDGEWTDLGSRGGSWTSVTELTKDGAVIGSSTEEEFDAQVGFLFNDGVMHRFNDLAVNPWLSVSTLFDANSHGQLVGSGVIEPGVWASFVATPIAAADLDTDGFVDGADLGILLNA